LKFLRLLLLGSILLASYEYSAIAGMSTAGSISASMQQDQQKSSDIEALRTAAEQGETKAQFALAVAYQWGRAISQSDSEAVKWFQKAAEQGDFGAQYNLGQMYYEGMGVTQDYSEALKWFLMAADRGDVYSQILVGQMLYVGKGTTRDYVKALMWLEIAGNTKLNYEREIAERSRNDVIKKMNSQQVSEAQRMAKDWNSIRAQTSVQHVVDGGVVKAPVPIYQPLPQYTDEARNKGIQGDVLIECVIRTDGLPDTFRVLRGLGYGLEKAAIRTIATEWHFNPGTFNGNPVDVQANIAVSFRLYPK